MSSMLDRRHFLKTATAAAAGLALVPQGSRDLFAQQLADGAPNAEKLGWRLGCQAYSFNRFTFYEAIDKVASLGLHWIEAYPGQRLSQEQPDIQIGESLSTDVRKQIKQRLADKKVQLVNYGVVGLPADEAGCRRTFDFAKDMGIETIVSEPGFDAIDTIEKLCNEYQINVALHNHPKPSRYWNPDTVLEVSKDRSPRIGACADTGHWMRSELNPVEQLKKLEGRIISFHFKDLNKFGGGAHDVPWGTGAGDVRAMLTEIHRQGVKAVFSIEYEHNWTTSLPEIAECVKYFDKIAAELANA
ncbi:MAG: sugar phosphate isomerase/epimerase [Pirellulaceae bacterium]|nr:sugar phosphate isomerase/epimerase [Pirellulaceae bacterium]